MERDTGLRVLSKNQSAKLPSKFEPTIVGYFSIDETGNYIPSAVNLKYLKVPNPKDLKLDLNQGYENVIHKPDSQKKEGNPYLLQFLLDNQFNLKEYGDDGSDKLLLDCDFICYRGLLRLVMCSPYEYRENWCIMATKYKGNIYLCEKETEERRNARLQETEQSKKICSYGFKLEQYLLSDSPEEDPDTSKPVKEAEEFSCVYKSNLEGHNLLYGAEMDGIDSKEICDITSIDPNTLKFIEMKVKRRETTFNQKRNFFKFKLKKWWCQSYLVGIKDIYVGHRNDAGIVDEITKMEMKDIPDQAREFWSPAVCVKFLNDFLSMVKRTLKDRDCPYTVYKFYWDPKSQHTILCGLYEGKNDLSFLPEWYIQN